MVTGPPRIELELLARRVRIDGRGRAGVTLRCAPTSEDSCRGTLRLSARVRSRRTGRTVSVAVGRRAFELAIRETAVVRVRLSSTVRATATFRDGVGELRTIRRSYGVRAPSR